MKKFYSEIRVIYADTDAMGIVYHGNYVKWFEIGRTEMLRQLGYPYSVMEKEKIWLPVISLSCDFKMPARYDDILEIAAWASELKGASITLNYEIRRKGEDQILVSGNTRHAITDPDLKPRKFKKDHPEIYEHIVGTMQ